MPLGVSIMLNSSEPLLQATDEAILLPTFLYGENNRKSLSTLAGIEPGTFKSQIAVRPCLTGDR